MSLDFQRLEQVLAEAAAHADPAERAAYLAQACGEDQELRAEVERLLAANEKAGDFLETPVQPAAEGSDLATADSAGGIEGPGSVIGRYKLLEEIGEGGFGVVYMAEQTEPVHRQVALKIVKAGMDTREVVARFEAERQALALMDHPSIARVFDGGVTGASESPPTDHRSLITDSPPLAPRPSPLATHYGRPYFVMELVRGIPITDFCDQRKLSTQERLRLFIQVCHAVQHAHQKGIIHRDLKPTNILVTLIDGEPVPKVIDFGVAKALGQRLTEKTLFTGFLKMIGTPAYMSPEQADLSGVDIDTRADIYALGVLLYELLTGVTPFDSETLRQAALDEIRRLIREVEPVKPSTRLIKERLRAAASGKSAIRNPQSAIDRDLDWIVMKCLEKDRGRRYETANNLASDIERHLNHEPVTAAAPSTVYRAQKFIRRHKAGLAIAAALVFLLAAGVVASTWQALRATRAEHVQSLLRVEAERAREQVEARAYASEMCVAAHSANAGGNLGSVQNLLSRWRHTQPDRRGWEWYYLSGLCHREMFTIQADSNGVYSVAWSPEGGRLASAGGEGVVRIWNASSGRKLAELYGHSAVVRCVAWSPDGRRLATCSRDATVRIWDAETGSALMTLVAHRDLVTSVAWSRDGTRLASVSDDGAVKVWDAAAGIELIGVLTGEPMKWVSWSPEGTRLAVCSDVITFVLDTGTGKTLLALRNGGMSVDWSPDGKWLASGGYGSRAKIRDAVSGTKEVIVGIHDGTVMCLAWSPEGRRLASGSAGEGIVKIGDIQSGAELQSFRGHAAVVTSVAWHPNGHRVASASLDGTVKVWEVNKRDPCLSIRSHLPQVMSLAWHPDGKWLAAGTGDALVRLWDTASDAEPVVLRGHTNGVWQVVWNRDGTRLAAGGWGGLVRVWQLANGGVEWSGQTYSSLQGNRKDVRSVAWSPDSKRLATVSEDGCLRVFEASNAAPVLSKDLEGEVAMALAWSPDGKQLAVGRGTRNLGEILLLDAITGQVQQSLRGHREGTLSLAWSPDGNRLASASDDTTARIWDAATGRQLHTLLGHSSAVRSVAWSPDGMRLATGSLDQTVRIWDPASGCEVCSLKETRRSGWVFAVAWSPDGRRIASGDTGGSVMIHDSTPGRALAQKQRAQVRD